MFPGLPALSVEGVTDEERGLLTAAIPGHLQKRVRDRIAARHGETAGLLELARGLSEAEPAGCSPARTRRACLATSRGGSRITTCAGFRSCPGQPGS